MAQACRSPLRLCIGVWLAFIAPILYLITLLQPNPKEALFRGYLFGLGFFGVGVSWVYISIHQFGGAPFWLAGLFTLIFINILSLYPGLAAWSVARLGKNHWPTRALLLFPASWVLFDYLRGVLFSGFPWLYISETQTHGVFLKLAPIAGIYGLSYIIILFSSAILSLFYGLYQKQWRVFSASLIILILIMASMFYFQNKTWSEPYNKPITVSLIQGNIPQSIKWDPSMVQTTLNRYKNLTPTRTPSAINYLA